jgi:hypothetical protein
VGVGICEHHIACRTLSNEVRVQLADRNQLTRYALGAAQASTVVIFTSGKLLNLRIIVCRAAAESLGVSE